MKLPYSLALATLGLAASYAAYAATPAVTNAIKARQASYKEIGGAFKSINDELKSGSPDMNSVRPLARDIATRAALLPKYFPKGSGSESGIKTRAKPEIWKDNAAFVKLQGDMITAAKAWMPPPPAAMSLALARRAPALAAPAKAATIVSARNFDGGCGNERRAGASAYLGSADPSISLDAGAAAGFRLVDG